MEIDKSMIQITPSPSKENRLQPIFVFLLGASIAALPASLYAYRIDPSSCCDRDWHPVLAIGAGYLSSSNLATSQNFPIINPVINAFYNYSPNSGTKTVGLIDAFLGVEWGLVTPYGLIFQLGMGYDQSTTFNVKGTLVQGADVHSEGTFGYQYDVTLRQLLVEGKLLASIVGMYHPYIFGGIGASFNTANSFQTTVPPFLTFTRKYANNTNIGFSYSLGVGLDIDLDQVFRVGIGYRFSDFGKTQLGSATIDGVGVPGTLSQSHVYTNEVLLQITCGFV